MEKFKAEVRIRLKKGILDPQGQAIAHALHALGFGNMDDVRTGKLIEFTITEADENTACENVSRACQRLLSNPVIEDFEYTLHRL